MYLNDLGDEPSVGYLHFSTYLIYIYDFSWSFQGSDIALKA
jgi:hypothetical protein